MGSGSGRHRQALGLLLLALVATGGIGARTGTRTRAVVTPAPVQDDFWWAYVADIHSRWGLGGTDPAPLDWYGRNDSCFAATVDTLNQIGIRFCILGGDWGEDSFVANAYAQRDSFEANINRATFTWLPVMGNHEALPSDTTAGNPFATAARRFPEVFRLHNWYCRDFENVRVFVTQNNCSAGASSPDNYKRCNPWYHGWTPGTDYDGFMDPASPQRLALAAAAAPASLGSRWLIVAGHRATVGSYANASTRWPIGPALRGTGPVKATEDLLRAWERGLWLNADEHVSLYFSDGICDSGVAAPGTRAFHHLLLQSGAGARPADSTDMISSGQWLLAYNYLKPGGAPYSVLGRTSEAWADTATAKGDADILCPWLWALFHVRGDLMEVFVFRCFGHRSAGWAPYNGAGNHKLLTRAVLERDGR